MHRHHTDRCLTQGPQGRRTRDSVEVLEGLEREFYLIASDNEPLVPHFLPESIRQKEPPRCSASVEDSNVPAPTWRDRDSSDDEVCEGGVRNAGDRASTPPSEVVDALEHDLVEVFAMSDDGRTGSEPPLILACERDVDDDVSSVHSESCWGETKELSGEDDVEWDMLPPAGSVAVQTVREEGCSAAPVVCIDQPDVLCWRGQDRQRETRVSRDHGDQMLVDGTQRERGRFGGRGT